MIASLHCMLSFLTDGSAIIHIFESKSNGLFYQSFIVIEKDNDKTFMHAHE